jgi:tRNA threonylcarbamoyladenosine biosynthesis protein TsaB
MTKTNIKTNPTILAIDSGAGICSVSIWKDGAISAYLEEKTTSLQAKRLINMVEEVLAQSQTEYSQLSTIASTIGPGSFTGIRIGLSSARAIGFAAEIPVFGFNSLEVIAYVKQLERPDAEITAMLNAGKGEVIYQTFSADLTPTCEPTLKKATGSEEYILPRADMLAQLAALYPKKAVAPLPFYVRPPDAKLPDK